MNKKGLFLSGGIVIVTIFLVVAYSLFNILGVTQSRVKRNEITITTESSEKTYDSFELSNDHWAIESGNLAEGDTLLVTMNTSITNPASVDNEIGVTILDSEGENVTIDYNIIYKLGTLTVHPIELTFVTESDSKVYDGTPLVNEGWYKQSGILFPGHHYEHEMNSRITRPGSIENQIGITIYNEDNEVVNYIYDIDYIIGTLTVFGIEITVSTESYEKSYDGTALLGGNATLIDGQIAAANHIVFGTEKSITIPGQIANDVDVRILDSNDTDVTSLYTITYNYGTLTVNPIQLVLESEEGSKQYDGLPLSNDTWTLRHGTLIANHELIVDMNNKITDVGSIGNNLFASVIDGLGNNVDYLYEIEYIVGSLTVNPLDITISTESFEKGYDGTPLLGGSATVELGELIDGHRLEYGAEQSIINPGVIDNEIDVRIVDEDGNNVTSSYNINYDYGSLTIDPITIILKSGDASKLYDGSPLSNNEWILMNGEVLPNHELFVEVDNQITEAGQIENTINAYVLNSQGIDVSDLYGFILDTGTLTVSAIDITVSTESYEKPYDGTPLLGGLASMTSGTLASGNRIEFGAPLSLTNPDTIRNTVDVFIYDSEGKNVTSSYKITRNYGNLKVLPISIIIKSNDASKVYDGEPLSDNTWTVLSGSLLENHEYVVEVDNQITNPGSIKNTIFASIVNGTGNDVSYLYNIQFVTGTLSITGRDIVISTESLTKAYDGSPLDGGIATIESGSLTALDTIQYGDPTSLTNPDRIINEVNAIIVDSQGNDVTSTYNVIYDFGTLTVQPISLIIKSNSANKVYDGEALFDYDWTLTNGLLLENHTLYVDIDSQITDVGSIDNSMYAYVLDDGGNNVSSFYDFNYNLGTLTIFSSAYSSSEIATESFPLADADAFRVYTDVSGIVYFRGESKGNYTMSGWTVATVQDTSITSNPLSIPASALAETGLSSTLLQVEYLREQIPYLVPYYTIDPFNGLNDIRQTGDSSVTNDFNILSYEYDVLNPISIQDNFLSSEEITYRNYVYNTYLEIPASTKTEMLKLADENSLVAGSQTIITDVQDYISTAASYNLDFAPIPDGTADVAIYFLTVSKEGICQHYATAATLMYRSLGIPARYVTGYLGVLTGGEWTTVTGKFAHAWVEVYVDGFGWMPVEVTGTGPASGGTGGDTGEDPVDPISITVKPVKVREVYVVGKVITASSTSVMNYLDFYNNGYRYEATYAGSLSTIGTATSSITSFVIYDEDNVDVTNLFDITYLEGELQLYDRSIQLITSSDSKVYDGLAITNTNWSIIGSLEAGHVATAVSFTGEQTNVGTSINRATIKITDEFGNDVTSSYGIIANYGTLTVNPRNITIQSGSSSKSFDGTALIDNTYEITSGSLATTDSVDITITGRQTGIGNSSNTIELIQIINNGNNVTGNYIIEVIEGSLTVTPPY